MHSFNHCFSRKHIMNRDFVPGVFGPLVVSVVAATVISLVVGGVVGSEVTPVTRTELCQIGKVKNHRTK